MLFRGGCERLFTNLSSYQGIIYSELKLKSLPSGLSARHHTCSLAPGVAGDTCSLAPGVVGDTCSLAPGVAGDSCSLAPGVVGDASELVHQRSYEDEGVLEEDRHAGVQRGGARHHVAPEQDPAGAQQGTEAHHEAHEEPDLGTEASEAASLVGLPGDLCVGHSVHHEHGDGGKHPAQVVHVHQFGLAGVHTRSVDHDPPAHREQKP